MIKYLNYAITFAEVPDHVSLTLSITNCGGSCPGCHSPELREDIGSDLEADLPSLLKKYGDEINCVCFLGDGNDHEALNQCLEYVARHGYPTCVYTGRDELPKDIDKRWLDYYKVGPYVEALGGLDSPITNQGMYLLCHHAVNRAVMFEIDITGRFLRKPM